MEEINKKIENFVDLNKEIIQKGIIDFNILTQFDYILGDKYLEDPKKVLKKFREILKKNIKIINIPETIKKEQDKIKKIYSMRGQAEQFYEIHPFFYDKAKIFYEWDSENKKYNMCDEIDLLNKINESLGIETIDSKLKNEIIESLKQIGRKNEPLKPEDSWVQFKEKIYDGKTGEFLFEANPEYNFKNPIDWNLGEDDSLEVIDKLFIDWVGEEHKQELYEFLAYCMTGDKFLQRMFALCGGGSNGKGTFIKLAQKFLGKDNCISSEIRALSENQFEPAVLHGKLLCIMGEVSSSDLKNTNMIKKIAGEDTISFQFKGKMPFTDKNTATCVCLTNSLPTTPDKSIGFYRKWHIIDFPNQFKGIETNLIASIKESEFKNLAKKCLNILSDLYKNKRLSNEGSFEDRIKKYEERSNPVIRFIEENCEENPGDMLPLREFTTICNEFLKKNHLRILNVMQIGKILREEGYTIGPRIINNFSIVVIVNLRFIKGTTKTIQELSQNTRKETGKVMDSFDDCNGDILSKFVEISPKNKELIDFYRNNGISDEKILKVLKSEEI